MNCSHCHKIANFICSCQSVHLCPDHIVSHLTEPGIHSTEVLRLIPSPSETEAIKHEAIKRIKKLEKLKQKIAQLASGSIKTIEASSKSALQSLDSLTRTYISLIKSNHLPSSKKSEVDQMLNSTLKVKKVVLDIRPIVEKAFNHSLFIISDKNKPEEIKIFEQDKDSEAISVLKYQESSSENKEVGRIEEVKVEVKSNEDGGGDGLKVGKMENEGRLGGQTLDERISLMESLGISRFLLCFGSRSGRKHEIQELLFSNNGKFCFVCKGYLGLTIYNLESKDVEWFSTDISPRKMSFAREYFEEYPECYHKHGKFTL